MGGTPTNSLASGVGAAMIMEAWELPSMRGGNVTPPRETGQ